MVLSDPDSSVQNTDPAPLVQDPSSLAPIPLAVPLPSALVPVVNLLPADGLVPIESYELLPPSGEGDSFFSSLNSFFSCYLIALCVCWFCLINCYISDSPLILFLIYR